MVEKGKIIKINGKTVTIERDEEVCSSCKLAVICSPAEKGRTVAVNEAGLDLAEGDAVAVSVPERKDEGYGIAVLSLPMLFFVLFYALSGLFFTTLDTMLRVITGLTAAGAVVGLLIAFSGRLRKRRPEPAAKVITKLD